jgi:hypothetical protein
MQFSHLRLAQPLKISKLAFPINFDEHKNVPALALKNNGIHIFYYLTIKIFLKSSRNEDAIKALNL